MILPKQPGRRICSTALPVLWLFCMGGLIWSQETIQLHPPEDHPVELGKPVEDKNTLPSVLPSIGESTSFRMPTIINVPAAAPARRIVPADLPPPVVVE